MEITNPLTRQVINVWSDEARKKSAESRHNKKISGVAAGAGSIMLGHGALDQATGMRKVYHFTPRENVGSILEKGILPRYGGRGSSDPEYIKRAVGKVHVSTIPMKSTKAYKVLKGKVSEADFKKMVVDPHNSSGFSFAKRIKPSQLAGGRVGARLKIAQRISDMVRGIKSSPARSLGGVGRLAGSALLAGLTAYQLGSKE